MTTTLRRTVSVLTFLFALLLCRSDSFAQTVLSREGAMQYTTEAKNELRRTLNLLSGQIAITSQLEERTSYVWNDEWTNETRTLYFYDETGRLAAWDYVWSGTEWVYDSVTKTTPGGSGYSLIVSELYDSETNTWTPFDQLDVDYLHEAGSGEPFINTMTYRAWDIESSDWIDVTRDVYSYNQDFTQMAVQTDTLNGGTWEPIERSIVAQDGPHVVIMDERYAGGGVWLNDTRTIFKDKTVKQLYRELQQMANEIADYEELMYGLHLFPVFEAQEWQNGSWVNVGRQGRTYDLFTGDVVEVITDAWMEGEWYPASRIFITYQSPGVVESLSFDFHDGESWMTFSTETYTRDDQGSIVEAIQQTVDLFGDGELVNSGKTTFKWNHLSSSTEDDHLPSGYALDPAYPNPFNPETHLTYRLAAPGYVAVRVYDSLGRHVTTLVDGVRAAGPHEVSFGGANLPSGQYIVRLEAPGFSQARVITLLK